MPTDHYRPLFEDDFSCSDTFGDLHSLGGSRSLNNYSPEFFIDDAGDLIDQNDETSLNMIGELPTSGEMSNSGNYQYNSQSSQGCNGPSQMTNQFAQYGGEMSNSGNYQYNSQSSQGCNGPSETTNQFAQNEGEMSNSGNYQYNSQSSHGSNGPSQMTNQFAQYGGEMSNSGNYQYNSQSSQGSNGPSQMTNQFAQYGDEELELRNRKRKSQESQTATSERISDVLEKGSIAENVVPDAAQSMSGEKRCIKVPVHFSVEVPRTTDSLLLKRIIMDKAVVALEEQIDTFLQVKKYEDETIIQSETVFPHESWPKPKPSQSPVQEYAYVLHQGRMIGNEIKISSDTGIYYENKIEPKPPQALVSPCPQSGANLIHLPCDIPHPLTRYAPTPDVVPQETHDRNTHTLGHKIQGHNDPVKFVSMAIDEGTSSSRELMVSPGADVNTLVPHQVCPKSNSSKKNKGRRRKNKEPGSKNEGRSHNPYKRSEVEALVEAVEKYGIGRWQQVYNEAFKNDDTRNGDDMRDKWKSLVETARRPPEKRRVLPLTDELLYKVLELEGAKEVARANVTSKPNRLRVKPTKSKC